MELSNHNLVSLLIIRLTNQNLLRIYNRRMLLPRSLQLHVRKGINQRWEIPQTIH